MTIDPAGEPPSQVQTPHSGKRFDLESISNWALLVVLGAYSFLFVYHAFRLILYPWQIDYGEGFILSHAHNLAAFQNPYQSITQAPWVVVHYPPVYPTLVALGDKLFGLQFHFGRFLSLTGILVGGYCLYRMIRFQTGDRLAAWIGGLLWVTAYPVYNWGTHHRVDSVGIGLEALGLMFLLERNRLKASSLCFLLALFTRQTLWVGPVAAYFYLRRTNGPREAAHWFGSLLLTGGIVFLILTALTSGEFYKHIVLYNANEFHWKDVWVMLHNAVMQMMKLQMAFLLYYLCKTWVSGHWDLAAYCIPLSVMTFCLVGKTGAATNYMFELTWVACWTCALVLAESRVVLSRGQPMRAILPLILFLGCLFPIHIPHFYGEWKIIDWGGTPGRSSKDLTGQLVEKLKEIPGPIFSQDAGVALLSGHDLIWDPFLMTQLTKEQRFDPTPFYKMIQERTFSALVLPFDLDLSLEAWKEEGWWSQFTDGIVHLIHQNYRVVPAAPFNPAFPDLRIRGYYSPFGINYLYLKRTS